MQKLWIISELFVPDQTSTAYILGEIALELAKKYDVEVIAGPAVYDKSRSVDVDKDDYPLPIHRIDSHGYDKNSFIGKVAGVFVNSYKLYRLAKKLIKPEDKVVVVTNPPLLLILITALRKKRKFDLTIIAHDVFPENLSALNSKYLASAIPLMQRIFDKAYSRADRIISIGRDMSEVLEQKVSRFNSSVKIVTIENWSQDKLIEPKKFPEDRVILQFAGNIGRVQKLDTVINSIPANIEFHIYGTGAMENTLKALNKPNVFFHGSFKRSEQTEILGNCSIAVVSLADSMYGLGVPSKSYNIMAAGRPILYLGPKGSEIYRMVTENGIGLTSIPENWDIMELKKMGERARQLATTRYSQDHILSLYLNNI